MDPEASNPGREPSEAREGRPPSGKRRAKGSKKRARDAVATPALVALHAAGVPYSVHRYDHDPRAESYGREAVEALGLDPGAVFKTLVAEVDGAPTLAVVPVDRQLDLRALAAAAGGKRAAMSDQSDAERVTGYVVGGISPVGTKRRLQVFVDASAMELSAMNVSAGQRGLEVEIAPEDLLAVTNGRVAPIAT